MPVAYRRTSQANQLRRRANLFAVLLAQLAPRRYEAVRNGDLFSTYSSLLEVVGKRFPIWIADYMMDELPDDEGELLGTLELMGIPISPLGICEDSGGSGSVTLDLLSYLLSDPAHRDPVDKLRDGDAWRYLAPLEPWFTQHLSNTLCAPPKGRQWAGRWQSLYMLVKYVNHDTNYQWLDISEFDMFEGGNPPWSLDDIESLAQDWKQALPVWTPLKRLINWLDGRPAERLPLLCAALTGDEPVRRAISQPKRMKTLAEVFNAQDKRTHAREG
jgi:hypothetical protein